MAVRSIGYANKSGKMYSLIEADPGVIAQCIAGRGDVTHSGYLGSRSERDDPFHHLVEVSEGVVYSWFVVRRMCALVALS